MKERERDEKIRKDFIFYFICTQTSKDDSHMSKMKSVNNKQKHKPSETREEEDRDGLEELNKTNNRTRSD
jgi:hypothetical protein